MNWRTVFLCALAFALGVLLGLPNGLSARAVASAYDLAGNRLGCGGVLRRSDHVVASRTLACGTRLKICHRARCTWGVVRDRGPWVAGRDLDLNVGVVRALGFASARAWGVRTVRWWKA